MSAARLAEVFVIRRAPHGDVAALRGLTLDVAEGEMVAVLGPSGAGKSTLLDACSGFVSPASGRVEVCGVDVGGAGERALRALRRTRIGVVRQHYHRTLPHELTVGEIAALPLLLTGEDPEAATRASVSLLDRAGLGDAVARSPRALSGGEQQRLAVCAALVSGPALVLADEPTGELDAAASVTVVALLAELARDIGAAVITVTHDPHVAARADRTVHLRDGRLSAEGADAQELVVDERGWMRLPTDLREQAGIGRRVRASAGDDRIELRPAGAGAVPVAPSGARAAPRPARPLEVRVDGLRKAYGQDPVLDGVSATFAPGRLHAVAGASGSGKTTLLHVVAGLLAPDAGDVLLGETRLSALHPDAAADWRARHMGYLSQHSTLAAFLSVAENVELGRRIRPPDARGSADAVRDLLERVGVSALADRTGDRLSGGEQRRVALARALVGAPSLLILDEPTAHLDRANGRIVIDLVRDAAHADGMTVIAASHDPDLLEAADSVLRLD
jgi:ABC-type lipoprotein export system ATPase subunit